jgi:hypothetical protein
MIGFDAPQHPADCAGCSRLAQDTLHTVPQWRNFRPISSNIHRMRSLISPSSEHGGSVALSATIPGTAKSSWFRANVAWPEKLRRTM